MAEVTSTARVDGRHANQIRPIRFQNHIAPYATGSTLVEWGHTRVICGVTVDETVPRWMKEQNVTGGWITAEYSMLPYSTLQRKQRDITKGKIDGRSQEIQRLIGRAMRPPSIWRRLGRERSGWIAMFCKPTAARARRRLRARSSRCHWRSKDWSLRES
jgi:ribonuclease PH